MSPFNDNPNIRRRNSENRMRQTGSTFGLNSRGIHVTQTLIHPWHSFFHQHTSHVEGAKKPVGKHRLVISKSSRIVSNGQLNHRAASHAQNRVIVPIIVPPILPEGSSNAPSILMVQQRKFTNVQRVFRSDSWFSRISDR